ncbi:hypothetical protein EVC37_21540 [Methylocaldum sp. BRCS4]|jgi:hypothetical protein|uniref:hypothetical protein n=1 Tax=Methylocaldum sp. TaxID=1969727 RepID=UPI0012EBD787|nr:hypothetical protein [Methylocaldum sp. BRCS4]
MYNFKRWALTTMLAVVAVLMFSFFWRADRGWLDLLTISALTAAASVGLNYWLDQQSAAYARRIAAGNTLTWDVLMNGVKIGTVTDAQYAAMQRSAFRDYRNAVAQLLNFGHMVLVALGKLVIVVPGLAFWMAAGTALSPPESSVEIVREVHKADPATIASAMRSLLDAAVAVSVIVIPMTAIMGFRFGFRNYYSAAVARMLRMHCGTPAEGDIHLYRMVLGAELPNQSACFGHFLQRRDSRNPLI